jgi:probable F420-dependent oxidoreductase
MFISAVVLGQVRLCLEHVALTRFNVETRLEVLGTMATSGISAGSADIRIGAVFPQTEIGNDANDIRAWILGVRDSGFYHVLAYDHVLSGSQAAHHPKLVGRYDETKPFHEVFVFFGFVAALAPELEAVTGVLILPQRQTALVAKQAAEIDILNGGRTRIGVGIGWNDIEYQGLNENFRNRASRIEEQIDVLRTLWTEPIVTVQEKWHTIDHAGLAPLPVQRPIPIWIGANADVALRRAARIADGFYSNARDLETAAHQMEVIRDELNVHNRDAFGIESRISVAGTTPEDWKREWEWWRQNGMTHLTVNTMGAGFAHVDQHLDALNRVLDTVSSQ